MFRSIRIFLSYTVFAMAAVLPFIGGAAAAWDGQKSKAAQAADQIWLDPVVWDRNRNPGAGDSQSKSPWRTGSTGDREKAKEWKKSGSGRPDGGRKAAETAIDDNDDGDKTSSGSGHGMGMGMGRGRQSRLNVRRSAFPGGRGRSKDDSVAYTRFWLEKPDNNIVPVKLENKRGAYRIVYGADQGGRYRVVGYNGNEVRNGSRLHMYSFYEFFSHGEHPDVQPKSDRFLPGYHQGRPKLELTRIYDRSRNRFRSRVGQRAVIQVSYLGQPLVGVPLTLTTAAGWKKTARTDEKGEAAFTLIKEDFPEGILDTSKSELYLFSTEYTEPTYGQLSGLNYDKERYVATLSFRVHPDNNEWESKHIALIIAMGTILVTGATISINRNRRRKRV